MPTGEVPKSIKASLYIDGQPAENSLKNVKTVASSLKREIDVLAIRSTAWVEKTAEFQKVNGYLTSVQAEVKGLGGAFGWLKTEIGKLGALAVGVLGFQFITQQFQSIIAANAKLSDSLAMVRQTTGLTEDEVRQLNLELKKIDTRTARAELLKIAEIGGQFNVPKEQLKGFVEQMDRANVVLGSEFKGGAEEITQQLALLRNNFTDIKSDRIDTDLGRIGNALVVLAQEGAATAPVVTEFSKRLSPLIATAHLTSGAILGLSATMQELAIDPERGGTAVVKIFAAMNSNVYAFAQVAGMASDQFKKLMNDSPMEAFNKVLTGFKKGGADVAGMNTILDQLEVSGVGAKEALVKLSQNTDLLTQRTTLATDALTKTDTIATQFGINNNTFGASIDRLSKKFSQLSANGAMQGFFTGIINLTSRALDILVEYGGVISGFMKLLVALGAAYVAYNVVLLASWVLQGGLLKVIKESAVFKKLDTILTHLQAAAYYTLIGATEAAAEEMAALNLVMGANPIGIVIAAITALGVAMIMFTDTITDAEKAQKLLDDIHAEAIEKVSDERSKIELLLVVLNDEHESRARKLQAVKALREIMPDHLKGYTDEQVLAGKATEAVNGYIAALEKRAEAEAAFDELKKLKAEELKIKSGQVADDSFFQKVGSLKLRAMAALVGQDYDTINKEVKQMSALGENQAKQDALKKVYSSDIKKELLKPKTDDTGNTTPAGDNHSQMNDGQLKAHADDLKKQLDSLVRGTADYKKVQADLKKVEDILNPKSIKGNGESIVNKSKELSELVKQFNAATLADLQSKNEKELQDTANKYDKLIDKENAFLARKDITKAQRATHQAELDKLEADKIKSVSAVRERQEKETNDKIADLRTSLNDRYESELQKETDEINKFYDDRLNNASNNLDDWFYIEENRAKDIADAKIREEQRFQEERNAIDAEGAVTEAQKALVRKARINKRYDDEILALKRKFSKELQLTKQFQDAVDKINGIRKKELDEEDLDKRKQKAEDEKKGAQTVANAVFEINRNNLQATTNYKLNQLQKDEDAELAQKNLTEDQKQAIKDKYAKEEAEIKLKAWKAQREADIEQAIINGAIAMTKVSAQTGILTFAFSPIVALETAAQIAAIAAQPAPQFADGSYSDTDPAGYVGQATLFRNSASGRPFVAGEKGREWIAPNWMVNSPRYANIIGMLETARKEKRAYATGGYNESAGNNPAAAFTAVDMTETNTLLAGLHSKFDDWSKKPWEFNNRALQKYQSDLDAITNKANPK